MPLDEERMRTAAAHLVGEHDFSSFRAAECQARTPMRNLHEIAIERTGERIVLTVCANAFLHHMVRNIAGVLIAIGMGERPTEWSAEVLAARDRTQGGITAPPGGLYLAGVRYAPALELPSEPPLGRRPGIFGFAPGRPNSGGPRIDAALAGQGSRADR